MAKPIVVKIMYALNENKEEQSTSERREIMSIWENIQENYLRKQTDSSLWT